jgi:hypothetical protein
MKLYGWESVGSSEEYRKRIEAEYHRLKAERSDGDQKVGLEEVKLRLFLSLLDPPGARVKAAAGQGAFGEHSAVDSKLA